MRLNELDALLTDQDVIYVVDNEQVQLDQSISDYEVVHMDFVTTTAVRIHLKESKKLSLKEGLEQLNA